MSRRIPLLLCCLSQLAWVDVTGVLSDQAVFYQQAATALPSPQTLTRRLQTQDLP